MITSDKSRELVLTVSQFLDSVNYLLGTGRPFIVGEVSEFKSTDRWVSFTLQDKEERALLKCVMGSWDFKRMGIILEDGMEVKVGGTPRVTKSYGSFSLWVSSIEPVGEGSLKKAYQLLLKKLEGEGLFARKRSIPEFISNIGVISSKDGVVIHDFMNNLRPLGIRVNFLSSKVEGADAVPELVRAIRRLNSKMSDLDALVIIRGGGSLESMQAFNNEQLCREIFASKIPVIAGIGHDVDVPIACLVADASVSTPTAAANLINSSWDSLTVDLPVLADKIIGGYDLLLKRVRSRGEGLVAGMSGNIRSVFASFEVLSRKIVRDAVRMIDISIERKIDTINRAEKVIRISDPARSLRLGYSLTMNSSGNIIRDTVGVMPGSKIKTLLAGGSIESVVENIKHEKNRHK